MFQKFLHRQALTVGSNLLAVVEEIFRLFVFWKVNEILNTFAHQFYSPQALTGQPHAWLELTIMCAYLCLRARLCAMCVCLHV